MQPSPSQRPNRRRFPRLELLERVEGRQVALDIAIILRDLSRGGFSCESRVPFSPGADRQLFRFTTPAGTAVALEARSIHCRVSGVDAHGQPIYVSGFEFRSTPATDEAVAILLDKVSSALTLE
jgi:hypothetical protein